ncbi:MAG TPA: hypothetical protein VIP09_11245 [Dehalococcoidia bacterium]
MNVSLTIEADDPKRISRLDVFGVRFNWPNTLYGEIAISLEDMMIIRAFRTALGSLLGKQCEVIRNPKASRGIRDLFSRPPKGSVVARTFGTHNPPAALSRPAITIELYDFSRIELVDDGLEMIRLAASGENFLTLCVRNVPTARKLIEILDEMIAAYDDPRFGADGPVGAMRKKTQDSEALIGRLRVELLASAVHPEIDAWSTPDFVRWLGYAARSGTDVERRMVRQLINREVSALRHAPRWTYDIPP